MRKLSLFFVLLMVSGISYAQNTNVSSSPVVDTDGYSWVLANYNLTLSNPSGGPVVYLATGLPAQTNFQGTFTTGGGFGPVIIPSNNAIAPSGTTWQLCITPFGTGAMQCIPNFVATGASLDLTSLITSNIKAPRFVCGSTCAGYGIGEITSAALGNVFYNATTSACQIYIGPVGVNVWAPCGTGGGSSIPGLASNGNNGVAITGGQSLSGGIEDYYVCTDTVVDNTHLTSIFAQGTGVHEHILGPLKCLVTGGTIVNIQSHSVLDGGGTTHILYQPSGTVPSPVTSGFIQNISSQSSPNRTVTDVTVTPGSNIITSTTGFTNLDINQGVTLSGVLFTTTPIVVVPNTWSTTIRYTTGTVGSPSTTAYLSDPIPLATSVTTGVTMSVYPRDTDITIKGVTFENNGPPCSAGANGNWWATFFASVNWLTIQDDKFQDGTSGVTTNGCKSIEIADASNIVFDNINFATWQLFQDGLDCTGPISELAISHNTGFTGDDRVSCDSSQNPYVTGAPFKQGPINNVTDTASNVGSGEHAFIIYGIDGVPGLPINNVTVRDLHCRQGGGPAQGASAGGAIVGVGNSFGYSHNVLVDGVTGNCGTAFKSDQNTDFLNVKNVSTFSRASGQVDIAFTQDPNNSVGYSYGNVVIDTDQRAGNGSQIISMDGTQTFNTLTLNNVAPTNFYCTSGCPNPFALWAISINTLNLNYDSAQYVSGSGGTNATMFQVGPPIGSSSSMTLGTLNVNFSNPYIASGTQGPLPYINLYNMTSAPNVYINSSSLMSATASTAGFFIAASNSGSVSSVTPNYNINGSTFVNVGGCIQGSAFGGTGSNVFGTGNSYSGLSTLTSCPANGTSLTTPSVNGAMAVAGVTTHYDNVTLTQATAPTTTNGTTATSGGTLTDSTQYFYDFCVQNNAGYACSSQRAVTTGNSGSNVNSINLTVSGTSNVENYVIGRSTTTNAEQICTTPSTLTPYFVFVQSSGNIKDTGWSCSGATVVPSTNTSAPSFTVPVVKPTAAQTVSNCSTSGTATFSEPLQGSSYKKVVIQFASCVGTASYPYPTAFTVTPSAIPSGNVPVSVATSISTTSVTVTGTTTTGLLSIEAY